jgi:hypothetical protein
MSSLIRAAIYARFFRNGYCAQAKEWAAIQTVCFNALSLTAADHPSIQRRNDVREIGMQSHQSGLSPLTAANEPLQTKVRGLPPESFLNSPRQWAAETSVGYPRLVFPFRLSGFLLQKLTSREE